MSSSERLRQAAMRLREVAEGATPGPWTFENAPNGFAPIVHADGIAVAETFDKPDLGDATYIATLAPPVALALADWLSQEAERVEWSKSAITFDGAPMFPPNTQALAVADAILGGDQCRPAFWERNLQAFKDEAHKASKILRGDR